MQTERQVPIDLEAERCLLGAMLLANLRDAGDVDYDEVRGIVGLEAFSLPDHRCMFKAACDCVDAGEPVEGVALLPRLTTAMPDKSVDDWQVLVNELQIEADAANASYYARQIRKAHQRREIIRAAHELSEEAYNPTDTADPSSIIASAVQRLETIDNTGADRDATPEADAIRSLDNPRSRMNERIPVALGYLGRALGGGFDRGSLVVIGARPSCGKTSLGLTLSLYASRSPDAGCAVLFISVEMSEQQIAERMMSLRSGVALRDIRSGSLDDERFRSERNEAAMAAAHGRGIYILDGVDDVRMIAAYARRYARRHGVRCVVVDYLQLLSIDGKYDRHDLKLAAMTRLLKKLAYETETAVVLLSQLNRAAAAEKRRPMLSDLRDSGAIEQDADVVLLIHRGADTPNDLADVDVVVAKQRQGDTGVVGLAYNRNTLSFAVR